MARGFTKHLQVTAALVGLALFAASLAPAEVPRKQSDSRQRARVEARAPVKQKTQPKALVLPAAADVPTPPVRPASAPQAEPAPEVAAAPAPAELPPEARLNMVRTAPEQIGQVPGHFFWIRQGLQAAQDPVDGQIVFMNIFIFGAAVFGENKHAMAITLFLGAYLWWLGLGLAINNPSFKKDLFKAAGVFVWISQLVQLVVAVILPAIMGEKVGPSAPQNNNHHHAEQQQQAPKLRDAPK